jgi:hypothetical protein
MDFGWAPRSHEILDLDGGGVSAVTCSLIPAWRGVISHCSRSQGRQQEPEVTTPPKPVPAASFVGTVLSQAGRTTNEFRWCFVTHSTWKRRRCDSCVVGRKTTHSAWSSTTINQSTSAAVSGNDESCWFLATTILLRELTQQSCSPEGAWPSAWSIARFSWALQICEGRELLPDLRWASLWRAKRNWSASGLGSSSFWLAGDVFESNGPRENFLFVHEQATRACDLATIKASAR